MRILTSASTTINHLAIIKLTPQQNTTTPSPTLSNHVFSPSIQRFQNSFNRAQRATTKFGTTHNPPQNPIYDAEALHNHFSAAEGKNSRQAAACSPP